MLSRLSLNAGCKLLLNTNVTSQKIATCRFSGLACRAKKLSHRNHPVFDFHKHSNAVTVFCIRYQSTENTTPLKTVSSTPPVEPISPTPPTDVLSEIPDPPAPQIQDIVENIVKFHPNGEPTFESLGLGGRSPPGIMENCLEFLHIDCGLPWWGAIMTCTLCIRLMLFPLVIRMQRNVARSNMYLPQMQELQLKMTEARQCCNEYEAMMYSQQLHNFMKKKGINPLKNLVVVMISGPVFLSMYWGLQKMATTVDSLKTGGLWWFTDLSVADPYYILPLITCGTLLVTLEIGTDTASAKMLGQMRYFTRLLPFVMLPFIINFPAVILTYWVSTNLISLVQVGTLRTTKARQFFNIPQWQKHSPKDLPLQKQGFVEGIQNSWTNVKLASQMADRNRADSLTFNNAGKGPIIKTYKYDPTKQVPTAQAILAKKR